MGSFKGNKAWLDTWWIRPYGISLLLWTVSYFPLEARLGLSVKKSEEKYGPRTVQPRPLPGTDFAWQFQSSRYLYHVFFLKGRSVFIRVVRPSKKMTEREAKWILLSNAGKSPWQRLYGPDPRWKTQNGKAQADFSLSQGVLSFYSSAWQKAAAKKKEEAAKKT